VCLKVSENSFWVIFVSKRFDARKMLFILAREISRNVSWLTELNSQGAVVRKPVNDNRGLKFNQGPCFSYFKKFSQQIPSGCLIATKFKMWCNKRFAGIRIVWL